MEMMGEVIAQTENVLRVTSLQMLPGQDVVEFEAGSVQGASLAVEGQRLPGTVIHTSQANVTIGESPSGTDYGATSRIGITVSVP